LTYTNKLGRHIFHVFENLTNKVGGTVDLARSANAVSIHCCKHV
jgi:hypothetical protein